MSRQLHLEVCAGFANRLRATISGICAAEDLSASITLSWPREAVFGATFTDLFDLSASELPAWISFDAERQNGLRMCNSPTDWERVRDNPTIRIKSYGIFYRPNEERWLQWLRRLRPKKEFVNPFSTAAPPIGVHIRRTDHNKAIEYSPTHAFVQAMQEYPSDTAFFLATDDPSERAHMEKIFAGRLVGVTASEYHRDTLEGTKGAFREFMQLAQCSLILGSNASSFSEMAAAFGGRPLRVITGMCQS